jgi:transposase
MTHGSSLNETIGLDLSDKTGVYVVLDRDGEVCREGRVTLTREALGKAFGGCLTCLVAIEVGAHSPWVSRELALLGHEVVVGNPRQVKLISQNKKKSDREDALLLAQLARLDRRLLRPVQHRGEQAQADLAMLRSRSLLVASRTRLINSVRGMVKTTGLRLPRCSADCFAAKARPHLPRELVPALEPLLDTIANLTQELKQMSHDLEATARARYPETQLLRQVPGVGLICSLTYVLTLEEPERFRRSRAAGAYLGLVPRQRQSGEQKPQMHITKTGDVALRSVLVQSAQYILGRHGPDSDLRRWGLKLAGEGNKARRKKAVIAVARKLAVLLHHLWSTGQVYEPLRQAELETVG